MFTNVAEYAFPFKLEIAREGARLWTRLASCREVLKQEIAPPQAVIGLE